MTEKAFADQLIDLLSYDDLTISEINQLEDVSGQETPRLGVRLWDGSEFVITVAGAS